MTPEEKTELESLRQDIRNTQKAIGNYSQEITKLEQLREQAEANGGSVFFHVCVGKISHDVEDQNHTTLAEGNSMGIHMIDALITRLKLMVKNLNERLYRLRSRRHELEEKL